MKLYKLLVSDTHKIIILYTQSFFGSQTLFTYQEQLHILQSFFFFFYSTIPRILPVLHHHTIVN